MTSFFLILDSVQSDYLLNDLSGIPSFLRLPYSIDKKWLENVGGNYLFLLASIASSTVIVAICKINSIEQTSEGDFEGDFVLGIEVASSLKVCNKVSTSNFVINRMLTRYGSLNQSQLELIKHVLVQSSFKVINISNLPPLPPRNNIDLAHANPLELRDLLLLSYCFADMPLLSSLHGMDPVQTTVRYWFETLGGKADGFDWSSIAHIEKIFGGVANQQNSVGLNVDTSLVRPEIGTFDARNYLYKSIKPFSMDKTSVAENKHQELLRKLAKIYEEKGFSVLVSRSIDLYVETTDKKILIEVKTITSENADSQISAGLIQLFLYREALRENHIAVTATQLVVNSPIVLDSKVLALFRLLDITLIYFDEMSIPQNLKLLF